MNKFYLFSMLLLVFGGFASCIPDPISDEEILKQDIQEIEDYLKENSLTAQSTASGLHYIIEEEGTGGHPTATSNVTVKYKGYLLDGTVFDETEGSSTATFKLNGLIEGWQEGIPLLQKGGKGKLFLPSAIAYGRSGSGAIPGNTPIAFDIELVDF